MASDSLTRVCLLGHTYIRRLRDFMDSNVSYKNLNLDTSFVVDIRARGGLTFRRIPNCLEFLKFTSPPPSICFMQLGSNDLCTDTPEKVVKNIWTYASSRSRNAAKYCWSTFTSTTLGIHANIQRRCRPDQHPIEGADKGNGRDQLLGAPRVLGRPDIPGKRWSTHWGSFKTYEEVYA